jgi:hypothetical protein
MLPDVDTDSTAQLPSLFCWTKYGTEAGEDIGSILERKEAERAASGGVFLWGVGNAVGPSLEALVATTARPRVIFTPMRSRPAKRDVAPGITAEWHRGYGLDGDPFEVPSTSRVTSRFSESRGYHYALVCRSDEPLAVQTAPTPWFVSDHVRNLRSGAQVGASQVTSVVQRVACALGWEPSAYQVAFSADLVAPYFVRLTEHSVLAPA